MVRKGLVTILLTVSALSLTACGGGSGGGSTGGTGTGGGSGSGGVTALTWVAGQFPPESILKNFCQVPRTGIDPFSSNNQTFPDKAGTSMHEKMWLRSWTNNTYLWYNEVPDNDPANFSTVIGYFNQLKTPLLTPSGVPKDNFHGSMPTKDYNQSRQSAVTTGYGIHWAIRSDLGQVPRERVIGYVEPGSPAELAGLTRGDRLIKVANVDFINGSSNSELNIIINGLFPANSGSTERFTFNRNGNDFEVVLSSANVQETPVLNPKIFDRSSGKVGYMQFNSFASPAKAQEQLINTITDFAASNINELVLDLRYNGGGALLLAAQLGYMLTGDAIIQDRIFSEERFNDKHKTINPVTGSLIQPLPFISREVDYTRWEYKGKLPELLLNRIYILTTDDTCSASESLINGLRGIDVEVILIGSTTCGKPYGFYPTDNCGTTYFTIQMSGANAKGFGDYADGFKPSINPIFETEIKGCPLQDDLSQALGDPQEGLLASALHYIDTGRCQNEVSGMRAIPWHANYLQQQAERRHEIRLRSHFIESPLRDKSFEELR